MKLKGVFKRYYLNILLGIDQFGNILMLGSPDETISSRLGRAIKSGRAKWFVLPFAGFVNALFKILAGQRNHVLESIEKHPNLNYELWNWIKMENKNGSKS